MNRLEYEALEDEYLPHEARTLYVMCIRRYMDYETGLTGIKRRVSYQMFKERLEVRRPARSPVPEFVPTQKQIRGYIDHLVRVGLIEKVPQKDKRDPMVFRCLLASTGSIRLQEEGQKQDISPGHAEGHRETTVEGHSKLQQLWGLQQYEGQKQGISQGQAEGHSIFSEEGHTSVTSVNTTTSSRARAVLLDGRVFPMTWDWEPTEGVARHCQALRVNWYGIPTPQRAALIDELRSYWVTQPNRLHTQDQWNRRLAQQAAKKQWGRNSCETGQRSDERPKSAVERVASANGLRACGGGYVDG